MTHLSDDELVLHYYGEDGPGIVAAERHLRACARCAHTYEALARTLNAISGLSQAGWAVYVLSAGALVLATTDASLLSVDSLIASIREPVVPMEPLSRAQCNDLEARQHSG